MATITAKLDAKNKQIHISDGTVTGYIDIAAKKIYLTDGSKTIDLALADLSAGHILQVHELALAIVDSVNETTGCLVVHREFRKFACTENYTP